MHALHSALRESAEGRKADIFVCQRNTYHRDSPWTPEYRTTASCHRAQHCENLLPIKKESKTVTYLFSSSNQQAGSQFLRQLQILCNTIISPYPALRIHGKKERRKNAYFFGSSTNVPPSATQLPSLYFPISTAEPCNIPVIGYSKSGVLVPSAA